MKLVPVAAGLTGGKLHLVEGLPFLGLSFLVLGLSGLACGALDFGLLFRFPFLGMRKDLAC